MTTIEFKITKQWILAGKAIFTVRNDKGQHYTFQIDMVEDETKLRPTVWFCKLLTGPDNESDYTYVGMVKPVINDGIHPLTVILTRKSKFTEDSQPVKVVRWALKRICLGDEIPVGYDISGEGRCGRCGRTLTHPDGVANDGFRLGFGPKCWEVIQGGVSS